MLDTKFVSSNQQEQIHSLPGDEVVCLSSSDYRATGLLLDNLHRQPLLSIFGPQIAAQFKWAVTTDTIETYEHCETSRFLHIDSVTLECLNQSCEVISGERALQHALRPGVRLAEEVILADSADLDDATGVHAWSKVEPFEPELMPFVRKMVPEPAFEDSLVQSDASPEPGAFSSLKVALHTKRLWLGTLLSWSHPLIARAQETASIQTQISQEPNFAPFTRRTTAS